MSPYALLALLLASSVLGWASAIVFFSAAQALTARKSTHARSKSGSIEVTVTP